jgi:glutaredoxin 2
MTKKEDLELIDELIRKKIITCLQNDETDILPELNTAIQYLAKNNVTAEKEVNSKEEDIKKRIAEASNRRKKDV